MALFTIIPHKVVLTVVTISNKGSSLKAGNISLTHKQMFSTLTSKVQIITKESPQILSLWTISLRSTIEMKTSEQHFATVFCAVNCDYDEVISLKLKQYVFI